MTGVFYMLLEYRLHKYNANPAVTIVYSAYELRGQRLRLRALVD